MADTPTLPEIVKTMLEARLTIQETCETLAATLDRLVPRPGRAECSDEETPVVPGSLEELERIVRTTDSAARAARDMAGQLAALLDPEEERPKGPATATARPISLGREMVERVR